MTSSLKNCLRTVSKFLADGLKTGLSARAYARGGLGLNLPLSLIFYEDFITCTKEINCFRILFAC